MTEYTGEGPKYIWVAGHLRREILEGRLKPGDKLPSFAASMERFGTTINTVDRAHAVLAQEGFIVRRNGVGTFVAEPQARGASLRPVAGTIACASMTQPGRGRLPYHAHLMEGVEEAASRAGLDVLLTNPSTTDGWNRVQGVLGFGESSWFIFNQLASSVPFVMVMDPLKTVLSISADDGGGIGQAVRHLLDLGHRRIGYLVYVGEGLRVTQQRLDAYYRALAEAGVEAEPDCVRSLDNLGEFIDRGRVSMRNWLQDGWRETGCTALLVQNDRAAIGAMEALRAEGIRIPEEVSVVGFDSTDECEIVTPRLTSVRVPLREIGARAVDLLARRIQGGGSRLSSEVLPTTLDVRESTGPAPGRPPGNEN